MTMNGKELHYTRGEAIKKARLFNGRIEPLSDEENDHELLRESLVNLEFAFADVLSLYDNNEDFNKNYPFEKNFKEVVNDVIKWVESGIA
jgi:hypothetical protein